MSIGVLWLREFAVEGPGCFVEHGLAANRRCEGEGSVGRELRPVLQAEAVRRLLPLLLLAACKTASSSESHLTAAAAETLDTQGHVETHIEEAPSKVTTTVEEFAPPDVKGAESGALTAMPPSTPPPTANVPDHGPLVKRTVTVEEKGAVTTATVADAKSQERGDSTLTISVKKKSSFDFMHSTLLWIGLAVMAAGGIALVLKLRGIL